MSPPLDDAYRALTTECSAAGYLLALRSPEGRELMAELIREAVAQVAPTGLRIAEFSKRSGIPPSTVRHYIKTGRLRATRVGRTVIIDASQLRPVPDDEIAAMAARARAR